MSVDTSMTTERRAAKSGDCGCGKPAGSARGSCTCTCHVADCPESGVLRPNFFAGQLLTEDDLQQITAYMTAKRRLTNRHVFGTGVVCGMRVKPDPQKTGGVIVDSGYALDCCGNDLVLPCPCPLDINAMVRDQGLDCGERCSDDDEDGPGKRQTYLLYVFYTDRWSEPVSPYSPGSTSSCQNTRVQELCRFELRCPPKKPKQKPCDSLADRLHAALDEGPAASAYAVDLNRWDQLCEYKEDLLKEPPAVTLSSADIGALKDAPDQIKAVTAILPADTTGLAAETTGQAAHDWTDKKLRQAVDHLRVPARTIARFLFVGRDKRTELQNRRTAAPALPPSGTPPATPPSGSAPTPTPGTAPPAPAPAAPAIEDMLTPVIAMLAEAGKRLGKAIMRSFSAATQLRATLLAEEIAHWTDTNTANVDTFRGRRDARLFVLDNNTDAEPYSFSRYHQVLSELSEEYAWAKVPAGTDFTRATLDTVCDQVDEARQALGLDLPAMLCDLLIPCCADCEDLGVLLASIEVRHCKVLRICNLVRNIIISPAALGYWLPLHEILAALCCGKRSRDARQELLAHLVQVYKAAADKVIRSGSAARTTTEPTGARQ
jgi:hypothetical protein